MLEPDEASDHQARADEEHEREGDFRGDQASAQTPLPRARCAARGLLQVLVNGESGQLTCRRKAERDAGEHRHAKTERQHRPVDANVARHRQAVRAERDERADQPHREQDAAGAADEREQDAFRQELRDDAPRRRAERHADGNLLLPGARARDEQTRHVGGRDQQQKTDRREQKRHHRLDVGDELRPQARDVDADIAVVGRVVVLERRGHPVHVAPGRIDRYPRPQAPDDEKVAVAAFAGRIRSGKELRVVRNPPVRRNPQRRLVGILHAGRHHAHNRRRFVVDPERASDRILTAAEPLAPEAVAHDRDARRAGPFVVWRERASEDGAHREHVEEIRGDHGAVDAIGTIGGGYHERLESVRGQAGKAAVSDTPVEEIRGRRVPHVVLRLTVELRHDHEFVRPRVGQRPE